MKHWKPSTESYAALLLVFVGCVGVLPQLFRGAVDVFSLATPVFLFAWPFAVSGVRRASGVARLAAFASLTALVLHAILLITLAVLGRLRV